MRTITAPNKQVVQAFLGVHPRDKFDAGTNQGKTLRFRGVEIFSYLEKIGELKKYPLGVILELVEPKRTSQTTKRHISLLRYTAIHHGLLK